MDNLMRTTPEYRIVPADLTILRQLANRKMEIAVDSMNLERKRLWLELHDGNCERPMVLAEWQGVMDKDRPYSPTLHCTEDWARGVENALRQEIWVFEELQDDHVVEPWFNVNWSVQCSDYGVQTNFQQLDGREHLTAKRWDPPIKDIHRDFDKLHPRTFSVDRERTLRWKAHLEGVMGDIVPIRIRGGFWWTMGMTYQATLLIGLENIMLDMYDDPEGLHRIMQFLKDDHIAFARWLEQENLLSLNDENDYVGSGSIGYTREFSQSAHRDGAAITAGDTQVLLESQETVLVGPKQFAEFVFPYQLEIAKQFGSVYYGCCEQLHHRWEVVSRLPNLRRVSIAPLCDQEIMAEAMGNRYTFSRKPNPTLVSTDRFDEELIRKDLRTTLDITKGHNCPVEMIMKDVHTLDNEPHRLARWVELAREEIGRNW